MGGLFGYLRLFEGSAVEDVVGHILLRALGRIELADLGLLQHVVAGLLLRRIPLVDLELSDFVILVSERCYVDGILAVH